MVTKPQRSKRRDGVLSSLDTAVGAMNLAKEVSSMTPAKAVFGTVSILLTMIRVRFLLFINLFRGSHVNRTPWSMK